MSLLQQPICELVTQLIRGQLSSRELTAACLAAITAVDGQVRAFLSVDAEDALSQAAAVDSRRARGEALGPLAGLPVGVKDLICVRGQPASCASRMLKNFVAPYDSWVAARLKQAGAVLLGRLNMDEFAMGSSSENSAFQVTANPWNLACTPGGSSSGSAAAVAARMVPLTLGSDTGGSIRQPAGLCGIAGLKPTYGRVSRYGLIAYASSLDQIGPLATDVYGLALLLQGIAGHDPQDSTSAEVPVPDYLTALDTPLEGLRIGVVSAHLGDGVDAETIATIHSAIELYRSQGATIVPVELPHSRYAVAAYYLIAPSEASSNLSRFDGVHYGHRAAEFGSLAEMYANSRGEGFGAEVKRRIMIGTYALSAGYAEKYYVKALQARRLVRQDYDQAFQQVDLILGPVTPTPAFRLGERTADPLTMYLSDIFTIGANLAGIPALSVPAGLSAAGLPIGMQLQGRPFDEQRLLRAARQWELATDFHTRLPPVNAVRPDPAHAREAKA